MAAWRPKPYTRAMKINSMMVMAALMAAGAAAGAQPGPKPAEDQMSALDVHQKIALAKVNGKVLERHAQRYPTGVNYEYLIEVKDGRKLLVDVDGKTRKVFAVMDSEPAAVETGEEDIEAPSPE